MKRNLFGAGLVVCSFFLASSTEAGEKEDVLRNAALALKRTQYISFEEIITRGDNTITATVQMAPGKLKTVASLNGSWHFTIMCTDGMIDEYHDAWTVNVDGLCKNLSRFPRSATELTLVFALPSGGVTELRQASDIPTDTVMWVRSVLEPYAGMTLRRLHARYPAPEPAGVESLLLPSSTDCMTGHVIYSWLGSDNFVDGLYLRMGAQCELQPDQTIGEIPCYAVSRTNRQSDGWVRQDKYFFSQANFFPVLWTTEQREGRTNVKQIRAFKFNTTNGSPAEADWSFDFSKAGVAFVDAT